MKISATPLFQRLRKRTPFSHYELELLIVTACARYKTHHIAKRHGRGTREIAQPRSEVKYIQRIAMELEMNRLQIHDAAKAYRQGYSILDHARRHAEGRYLLKMDFKDFFPSIGIGAITHRLAMETEYSEVERWILGRILTKFDSQSGRFHLAIGAPSSPLVSNFVLHEFDSVIDKFCSSREVRYTRYADDLAFSTMERDVLRTVEVQVKDELSRLSYLGLTVNEEKTVHVSRKHRRSLVGLTLTNEGEASVGRRMKREFRLLLHKASTGNLPADQYATLRGRLAFAHAIDGDAVQMLLKRYGFNNICEVQSTETSRCD